MAGKKMNLLKRVQASSILEVVISMVVIVVVFGIAMMIYANVSRMSLSGPAVQAKAVLQQQLIMIENNTDQTSQSFKLDSLNIEQEIKPYREQAGLLKVRLTAYDTNRKLLSEVKKIIVNNARAQN